jgi:hypothetical protein
MSDYMIEKNVEFVHISGRSSLARLTAIDRFFSIIVL